MTKRVVDILIVVMLALAIPAHGKKKHDAHEPFLTTRISHDRAVVGEVPIYEVVLCSPDPDIAGFEVSANPVFGKLGASRSAADSHLEEAEVDGERCFTIVIDRFFVGASHPGKYKLEGGRYLIGYNCRMPLKDPFWGTMMGNRVETVSLDAPDLNIVISPLPEKNKPSDFSGAVGKFDVEVVVPSGEISMGSEGIALVTISGMGDLSEAMLPDVRKMFPESLQFKSMTESRTHFVKDGKIGSEIEMECVFLPSESGDFEIGECRFSFFNPETRKYEQAVSTPVALTVVSSAPAHDSPPQYMDI